jgi:hypothetical protein
LTTATTLSPFQQDAFRALTTLKSILPADHVEAVLAYMAAMAKLSTDETAELVTFVQSQQIAVEVVAG